MKEIHELELPGDVRYAEDHEWARSEDGRVRVGLSDYAQDQLGDIVFVELPQVGQQFERGAEFGTVESVKAVAECYLPVGGEILEVNQALEDSPGLVNESPYEEGWLLLLKPKDSGEMDRLMDREAYLDMLKGIV